MLTSNNYVLDESPSRLTELASVPDAERHDRAALWRRLRRDGYLLLRGAIDPEDVLRFRRYYFGTLAGTGLVRAGTDPVEGRAGDGDLDRAELRHRLFGEIVPGEPYRELCRLPAIRDWYEWFLGGPTLLHRRRLIRHMRPGELGIGTATHAHYDLLYLREGTNRVLTSWVPLGDCPVDLGGLIYLEGTHEMMRKEEEAGTLRPAAGITADLPEIADRYDTRWMVTDYEAGDMVVHSAYIVHASLDNHSTTGRMRLSTDIRYQRADEEIDWRWGEDWAPDDGWRWNPRTSTE